MEFVTQLWAYKSERFYLGIQCPEILKNHIWLLLIVLKTAIVGFSLAHLTRPDYFANFFQNYSSQALTEAKQQLQQSNDVFKASGGGAHSSSHQQFQLPAITCSDDKHLQVQLIRYYYWQGATIAFLFLTYLRVLRSGVSLTKVKVKSDLLYPLSGSQSNNAGGIEFTNNKIKIRKQDPRKKRDELILKSWTGGLLSFCSIMGAIFSLYKLLPAIYGNGCHHRHSWAMSAYPGATFALIESLISLSCLALLLVAASLTALLDQVPKFFLLTLPTSYRKCRRRLSSSGKWQPKNYSIDYGLSQSDTKNLGEYDCSQLTEHFKINAENFSSKQGSNNISSILRPTDHSAIFLNDSRLNQSQDLHNTSSISFSTNNLSYLTKLV